ncbi:MAG: DUF368 domain-containing protein [Ruminococcaceae bacterium]|nr:DUF368 domain-containing protein [Oscillospiraceae bacterium]
MSCLINFLKGILVGVGGIAPGLSGSVMLLILGLYERCINAIGTLFKNFKKNLLFLVPLVCGFGVGILLFSKVVDFLLINYEFHTRYLFLGLVIGTLPLFYKTVKKKGFALKHWGIILVAAAVGVFLFSFNKSLFAPVENPNLLQSAFLGVAVAGSSIIPGVDSAVILSSLGLYELYVGSIADLNFVVLIPAGVGLIIGAILISKIMNFFIDRFYTGTFSIIFGLFLSIIPNVLNRSCSIDSLTQALIASLLIVAGFLVSYYFGDIKENNEKIKKIIKRKK